MTADLGCPLCHALPNEMCVTPTGKARNDHVARTKEHVAHLREEATQTLGKTVVLPLGAVVTDIGNGLLNGKEDPLVRRCVTAGGLEYVVMARVIRDLPPTTRRDSITYPIPPATKEATNDG